MTVDYEGWNYDNDHPAEAGIYAILYMWCSHEGTFSGETEWDGRAWLDDLPIVAFSKKSFTSRLAAEAWAYNNDPNNFD